jgi:hypothetical protein
MNRVLNITYPRPSPGYKLVAAALLTCILVLASHSTVSLAISFAGQTAHWSIDAWSLFLPWICQYASTGAVVLTLTAAMLFFCDEVL